MDVRFDGVNLLPKQHEQTFIQMDSIGPKSTITGENGIGLPYSGPNPKDLGFVRESVFISRRRPYPNQLQQLGFTPSPFHLLVGSVTLRLVSSAPFLFSCLFLEKVQLIPCWEKKNHFCTMWWFLLNHELVSEDVVW